MFIGKLWLAPVPNSFMRSSTLLRVMPILYCPSFISSLDTTYTYPARLCFKAYSFFSISLSKFSISRCMLPFFMPVCSNSLLNLYCRAMRSFSSFSFVFCICFPSFSCSFIISLSVCSISFLRFLFNYNLINCNLIFI